MKSIFVCLMLVSASSAQTETTTEALVRAQGELSVGHEFTQLQVVVDRNIISSYIHIVNELVVDSFMDTYSEMAIIQDDTTLLFDELQEQNACTEAARARWDLQILRYGQKLSECLLNSVAQVTAWNNLVNSLHTSTQTITNQVQNSGIATLSVLDDYTDRDSLYEHINNRFRRILLAASPYLGDFEEFRASVIDNEEAVIDGLTQCDRALAAGFAIEAREDFQRAQGCF